MKLQERKHPYNIYNIYNNIKNQILTVLYDVVFCSIVLYSKNENTTKKQHVVKYLIDCNTVVYK